MSALAVFSGLMRSGTRLITELLCFTSMASCKPRMPFAARRIQPLAITLCYHPSPHVAKDAFHPRKAHLESAAAHAGLTRSARTQLSS